MRTWGDLKTEEKELFRRIVETDKGRLMPSELFALDVIRVDMLCRPLDTGEINTGNYILDHFEAGIFTKEAC